MIFVEKDASRLDRDFEYVSLLSFVVKPAIIIFISCCWCSMQNVCNLINSLEAFLSGLLAATNTFFLAF
jgi:hypothetical protein